MQLKAYPLLGLTASARHLDGAFRLWTLARSIDTGSGWAEIADVWQALKDNHICTRATMRNHLDQGRDVMFRIHKSRLYYFSVVSVAQRLEARADRSPVYVPIEHMASLRTWRSALLAALFADKAKTMSQRTLAEMTGTSMRTVRNYIKDAKRLGMLTVMRNAMVLNRKADGPPIKALAERGVYRAKVDGVTCLLQAMPNTYASSLSTANRGQLLQGRYRGSCYTTERPLHRRYFDKAQGMRSAFKHLQDGQSVYCRGTMSDNRRARLWEGYTAVGDRIKRIDFFDA